MTEHGMHLSLGQLPLSVLPLRYLIRTTQSTAHAGLTLAAWVVFQQLQVAMTQLCCTLVD
jgi:hypothetical protein